MAGFGGLSSIGGISNILMYLGIHDVNFSKGLDAANTQADRTAKTINKAMNVALAAGATAFATAAISAAKFQKEMSLVDTLLGGADQNVKQLSKSVLDYAQTSSQSISDITKALYDTVSAGVPASQAMDTVALSAKAAGAGFTSVDVAGKAGIATMNAYGLGADSLNKIFDLQFSTVKYGVLTYEQLANAIGNVLPSAAALGVKMEEVYGAISHLTKAGIDTSSAATYLNRLFTSLVENRNEWKAIGADIFTAKGEFAGMEAVFGALQEKLNGLTKEQQAYILESLKIEDRSGKAVKAIVANYEGFSQTMTNVANSAGSLEDAHGRMTDNIERQAKIFKNIIQVGFIESGEGILTTFTPVLKLLNQHPEAIKLVIKEFSAMAITAATLVAGFKIYNAVAGLIPGINKLAATSFGPWGLAITAIIGAITLLVQLTNAYQKSILSNIEAVSDQVLEINSLEKEYKALKDIADPTEDQQKRLKYLTDELTEAYEKAQKGTGDYTTGLDNLLGKYKEFKIENLKDQQEELRVKMEETAGQTDVVAWAIKKLGIVGDDYKTGIQRTELGKLQEQYNAVTDEIKELETGQKALNSIGIQTTAQIKEEISQREALLKTLQPGTAEYKALTEQINNLKEKIGIVIPPVKELKSAQELLKDAGIETTKMVKSQISELERLLPIVKNDEYATKQLKDQMADLYLKIGDTEGWKNLIGFTEKQNQAFESSKTVVGEVRGKFDSFVPKLVEIGTEQEKSTKKFEFATKSVGEYGLELIDAAGQMGLFGDSNSKASKAAGLFAGTLETVLKGGFDPLSLGISVVTGLFGIFGGSEEKVVRTTEQVIESLGPLGEQITKTGELVDDLTTKFSSSYINNIKMWVDYYVEALRTATGETRKRYEEQLAIWQEYMNAATQSFKLTDEFDKMVEGIDYVTKFVQDSITKFGEAADKVQLTTLLNEQINSAMLMMNTLDPLSPAYAELADKVRLAIDQIVAMGGSVDFMGQQVDAATFNLTALIGAAKAMGMNDQTRLQILAWSNAMFEAGTLSDYLVQELLKLGFTLEQITGKTKEVDLSFKNLNNDVLPATQKHIKEVSDGVDKLNLSWKNQNDEAIRVKQIYEAAEPVFKKVAGTIRDQDNALGIMKESLIKTRKELANFQTILTALLDQKLQLKIEFETKKEDLEKQIADWQATYDSLVAEKKAVNIEFDLKIGAAATDLGELQDIFEQMDRGELGVDNLYELSKALERISGQAQVLTIDWEDMLDVMFADYDNMTKDIDTATKALEKMQYFKIDFDTTDVDENIQATIFRLNDFLGTLSPDSPAYKDAKKSLDDLILKFIEASGEIPAGFEVYQKLQADVAQAAKAVDDLYKKRADLKITLDLRLDDIDKQKKDIEKKIDDLYSKKKEVSLKFEADISAVKDKMNIMGDVFRILKGQIKNIDNINFYELSKQIEDLTGISQELKIVWGDSLDEMFADYDSFNKDIKTATDALDKMMAFEIDFDTSKVDDSIVATIFKLDDFLATLSPNSPAYKDAKKAMDGLIVKFIEASGNIPAGFEVYQKLQADAKLASDELDRLIAQKERIPEIEKAIEDTEKALSSLYIERANITSQYDAATSALSFLSDAYAKLASDDPMVRSSVNMNEFAQAVALARGEVDNLGLSWDAAASKMFSDFDQFFKYDTSTGWKLGDEITDVMDKIKFFKIDFDTSDVDEDLNVLIFRMQDFIGTLDPSSEAYTEATRMFDNLKAQFIALGGVVDENAAIEIVAGDSESTIADLETLIAGLGTQQTQVDLDIAAATAKLTELQTQLTALKGTTGTDQWQVDLDIEAAKLKLADLQTQIAEFDLTQFLDKKVAIQFDLELTRQNIQDYQTYIQQLLDEQKKAEAEIDLDISKAEQELANLDIEIALLKQKYEEEKLVIDLDIADAEANLATLQAQLDAFDLTQFLDKEAALKLAQEEVNNEVERLQTLIQNLIRQQNDYNVKIDADIDEAANQIMILQNHLAMLISDYNDTDLQLDVNIADALAAIAELQGAIDGLTGKTITVGVENAMHEGGLVMHAGGLIRAHSGLLNYNERPIIAKVGEAVIPDYIVDKYPEQNWRNFISTGDVRGLVGNAHQNSGTQKPIVIQNNIQIKEANRWTYAQVYDDKLHDRALYNQRKLEVSSNPF